MPASLPAAALAEGPGLVHYLPVGSTLISAAFVITLLLRASKRHWAPHLVWWGVGVFFYGVGTALESAITIFGNTPTLNKLWYWAGAILGAYALGVGSCYLLLNRKWAHTLTAISGALVVFASVAALLSPFDPALASGHRPTTTAIEWQWVRSLTPLINLYAAFFLIGGAMNSSIRFFLSKGQISRAIGTALIAAGAILPGIGGALTRTHDLPEALYIGELTGIILIWIGYEFCIRAPRPNTNDDAPPSTATA